MSYNFIAEITEPLDWLELKDFIDNLKSHTIEVFPISRETGGDFRYIGISIPFLKLDQDPNHWAVFCEFYFVLTQRFKLRIFDFYNGIYINEKDLPLVKKSLYG